MILNVYKPPGPTSHDIVDQVRKLTGEKRVGHAGTLDPFAEGVLIVLVGKEATKRQNEFLKMDKTYVTTIRLGATSDTDDLTGNIKKQKSNIKNTYQKSKIQDILKSFIGEINQVPPIYSAIKIKGKKAYELARSGEKPQLKPKKITIYDIKLLEYTWPHLEIEIKCASGTYIRALARDIGQKLETGAYVEKLTRTAVGKFTVKTSITLEDLKIVQGEI